MKTPARLVTFARDLRQRETNVEARLWHELRSRKFGGHKWRRQHPLGGYVLDFYCDALQLCLELDGWQHVEPAQAACDDRRTTALKKLGVKVVRLNSSWAMGQFEAALARIAGEVVDREAELTSESGRPSPPAPLP